MDESRRADTTETMLGYYLHASLCLDVSEGGAKVGLRMKDNEIIHILDAYPPTAFCFYSL